MILYLIVSRVNKHEYTQVAFSVDFTVFNLTYELACIRTYTVPCAGSVVAAVTLTGERAHGVVAILLATPIVNLTLIYI